MIMNMWFTIVFGTWGWLIALAIAIVINVPVFIWVRLKKHLTFWGCILAGFFGIAYWMIHPIFYIALFTFFISSSILTRYRKKDKEGIQDKFDKGGERDTSQVLANGLAGFIFAALHLIIYVFTENIVLSNAFIYAFITAIATTNADTWGTEIGILSKDQPYWILNLNKKVEHGTSGGVSLKGTGAALIGALIVTIIVLIVEIFWKNPIPNSSTWQIYLFLPIAGMMGFVGAIFDSMFGATLQGFFKCTVCGKGTEKRIHCKEPTELQRGKEWFRNDHVNFWSSFLAGCLVIGLGCFAYLL
ncbi:MAG: DUF92 domain-containing protein [Candidatus Heimdallarchaeota archaeon]|nr:DUF92 domain-containing protein [Candidatus Heimdallarchaeota archaeon]